MALYLDGAAWAQWAGGLATYLAGDPDSSERLELVPAAGGDAVPFVHDAHVATVDRDDSVSPIRAATMIAYVGEELGLRTVYTYAGRSWTVEEVETDRAGSPSAAFPYRTTLVQHAG